MATITIQRAAHGPQNPYIKISRAQVLELPANTLGVLVKMLAFGEGWEVSPERIKRETNLTTGEFRRAEADLRSRGHLTKGRTRDNQNRITGARWLLKETPSFHDAEIHTMETHSVENHHDGKPSCGSDAENFIGAEGNSGNAGARAPINPDSINLKDSRNQEEENNDQQIATQETPAVVVVVETDPSIPADDFETETPTGSPDEIEEPVTPLEAEPAAAPKTVFQLYAEEIGGLTPMVGDELDDLITTYSEAWVRDAIRAAVRGNARSMRYILGVLRNMEADGKERQRQDALNAALKPDTGRLPDLPLTFEPPAPAWLADGKDDTPPAPLPGQSLWHEAAHIAQLGRAMDACTVTAWDGQTLRLRTNVERFARVLNGTQQQIVISALAQVYGQPVAFVVELAEATAPAPADDVPLFAVEAVQS